MPVNDARIVVRGGRIVSMDPAVGDLVGDVLIEGERIAAIGRDLGIDPGAAEVIDASDHIVVPGFIDSHRHLYQAILRGIGSDWSLFQYFVAMFGTIGPHFTPADMHVANTIGALDALDSGVTTVFDWSHNQHSPEHTDELVRALKESRIRAVFGYGGSMAEQAEILAPPFKGTTPSNASEIRRVREQHCASDDARVTLGFAARGPESSTMEIVRADWALARELAIRVNIHIGMAVLDVEGRPSVARLHDEGLLGEDLIFGHCNLLTDDELRMMADAGVKASVTPEDECAMGHGWPPIARLLKAGIRPNIGADTCMAVGGDPFTAMRFALAVPRGISNQRSLEAGENPWALDLTARDVLAFATIDGARTLGLEARTGSLTPGKQADVVMLRTDHVSMAPVLDPIGAIVHHASRGVVDHVFVGGEAVKRDGRLVGVDSAAIARQATEAGEGILARAGVTPGWVPDAPQH